MLGCISLHIASKLNEKTIISIDSYMECCMNIFTKIEFEQKEVEVYKTFDGKIPSITFVEALDVLEFEIMDTKNIILEKKMLVKSIIRNNIRNLEFLEIQPLTLAANLYA